MAQRRSVHIQIVPNTWLGRLLAVAAAAVLLVLAFFFLSFVLIMLGVVLLAGLLRLLVPTRRPGAQAADGAIEGQYTVERDEPKPIDSEKQITPKE